MSNNDAALPIAVKLIAGFEGFRASPYQDGGGVWTQGYGCTYHPSGRRVMPTEAPITEAQGLAWLERMALAVLLRVRLMVVIDLTDNEAAALTSLAYNEGTYAVGGSTLIRLLNTGRRAAAKAQFDAWVYDNGEVIPGLVRRRAAEAALFAGDSESDALNQAQIDKGKIA